ncbi:30S ribosomal protein S20 [Candidatus Gromoviella agglomerans]|uniref:30S ribosomal protein S20 n=1 Tax=Candidatus Gromoviella agglomerans TaxID=2806609 RepID=UPI001E2F6C5A|nr:30S ribosomal protein S20 [Candidatus Gromoviella agglomerans]UFX98631.1 30S ribosomal protein S20 [Candidatus Gromoviella agglomerans]
MNRYSKKKLVRTENSRRMLNKSRISRVRTFIKKFISVVNGKSISDIRFNQVQSEIMKGVTKGVLKLNTASRKISRLHKLMKKQQLEI